MHGIGTRLGILGVAAALVLSACTGSDTDNQQDSDSPTPIGPEPVWTAIEISDRALPDESIRHVRAAVSSTARLPYTLTGTIAAPGQPRRAVLWHPTRQGAGKTTVLDVGGQTSLAHDIEQVGAYTYVTGEVWEDNVGSVFIQRSSDRRRWEPVAVPEEAIERGVTQPAIADDGSGNPILFGTINGTEPAVVNLEEESVTILSPLSSGAVPREIVGVTSLDGGIHLVVEVRQDNGINEVVGLESRDRGVTWQETGTLPGQRPLVTGAVNVDGVVVATGSHVVDGDRRAVAWSKRPGARWKRERVPHQGLDGWDTWLSSATRSGRRLIAAVADDSRTSARVVERSPSGTWVGRGPWATDWQVPGTTPVLAMQGSVPVLARTDEGRFQVGWQGPRRFRTVNTSTPVAPASDIEAVWADDDGPVLVGTRKVMEVYDIDGTDWRRRYRTAPYRIDGTTLTPTGWHPSAADDLDEIMVAAAPDGSQIMVGERDTDSGPVVVGWFRGPGGTWKPARGLTRDESGSVRSIQRVGTEWVLTGADDAGPGVWTSANGRAWRKERTKFSGPRGRTPALAGACALPDDSLLVVGWYGDRAGRNHAIAFQRTDGAWSRASTGVGEPAEMYDCTTTPTGALIQGSAATDTQWFTSDGKHYEPAPIDHPSDHVADIIAVPGGFAALGQRQDGKRKQPTVWLSRDGLDWTPIAVPLDQHGYSDRLVVWDERLVATFTHPAGPLVFVLDNLAELLAEL